MSAKKIIIDLYRISKKRYYGTFIPVVSFEDLGLRFQHPDVMLLRDCYLLRLSNSPQGVQINRMLLELSPSDFIKYINLMF